MVKSSILLFIHSPQNPHFNNTRKPTQERNNVSPDIPKLDAILDAFNT